MFRRIVFALAFALAYAACGPTQSPPDAGQAGSHDSGTAPGADAGGEDAGTDDAGTDAGVPPQSITACGTCASDADCAASLHCTLLNSGARYCLPGCTPGPDACTPGFTCTPVTGAAVCVPSAGCCLDGDGDGYGEGACLGQDCDDTQASAHPGGIETCDGVDNDCDGTVDGMSDGCYDGPAGTEGVGLCQGGTHTCTAGAWSDCAGEVVPGVETCDGLDNNCDGQTDDGLGTLTCGVGACERTSAACANGQAQSCTPGAPSSEVCDGIDNNCDGQVDEGFGMVSCGTGACATSVSACLNGQPQVCSPGTPSTEVCDGVDNDCNGQVDNGNPGGGQGCNTGLLGACSVGTTACSNGTLSCNQNTQASPEACDGVDNNCNGIVDEGNPGGGAACSTGLPGVCAGGTTACTNGAVACAQNVQPAIEVCDGLDNNCNGQVDDGNPGGGVACNTGKAGICGPGTTACTNAVIVCNQNAQPATETCSDGVDNDCDAKTDCADSNCLGQVCAAGKVCSSSGQCL